MEIKMKKTALSLAIAAVLPAFANAEKVEVEAMQRRYNSLSIFAADKGCVVGGRTEISVMACSVCGVAKVDMVVIDNKVICPECYKKQKSAKEKAK